MQLGLVSGAVIILLIVYLFNKYFIRIYKYWDEKGIPLVPGALPIIGHTYEIFWTEKSLVSFCEKIYQANRGRSMVGFFQLTKPTLMLFDPELIKTVLVKDFPKFHKNVFCVNEKVDRLLAKNPFFTHGDKWKFQRNRLSYALMSSKRLRILCYAVANVCKKFSKYLEDQVVNSKDRICEIETKEFANCFTGEVVASAGFGIEGDFFVKGSGPNSFREAVDGFLEPTFINTLAQMIFFLCPTVNIILQIPFLPKKIDGFFRRVVHEMIAIREKDGIPRHDFLQLMLENSADKNARDEENITASATSLFLDGYETSAITLGFFAYQLAENTEVQEKLSNEVNAILEKYNGEINYEALGEMTYMDQALNESMRLYPALGVLLKKSSQPCTLVGEDGLECTLEPGIDIIIPVQAIHREPKYWGENPDTFNPERFGVNREHERPKMAFLPFGEGPRICVGMRFAVLQIKAAICTILKDFSIEKSAKNNRPLVFGPGTIFTSIEGGVWVTLRKKH